MRILLESVIGAKYVPADYGAEERTMPPFVNF
jgi:hypothetical protein